MKYREWLAEWSGDIIRRTVKETTRRYGDVIRLYINPSLGEMELKDITALTLRRSKALRSAACRCSAE